MVEIIPSSLGAVTVALKFPRLRKTVKLKPSLLSKFKFIEQQASKGNTIAKQYLEKLKREQVSIDWAHRVLMGSIRQQRMLKMMAIADCSTYITAIYLVFICKDCGQNFLSSV